MSTLTEQVRKALKLEKDNTWKNVITYRERTTWLAELCDLVDNLERIVTKYLQCCDCEIQICSNCDDANQALRGSDE